MSDYKECITLYFDFYERMNEGTSPKFDGADGKLLKKLIKHLKTIGEGSSTDNLNAIFCNWGKLERQNKFYRHNHDIKMIYSCINSIVSILTSKNGQDHRNIIDSYK